QKSGEGREGPPVYSTFKRLVVGRPIATSEEEHQRLGIVVALAVFASDAISSTAYASEEILHVLTPAAAGEAIDYLIPIALLVGILLILVVTSYRQTIKAYPQGGGTYVVSRENLGVNASLVAGASILVDYILTVAVSVSAGVAAITSAAPSLREHTVVMALGFIALMTVANLRGLKESGRLFAGPTYTYILVLGVLLVWGLLRSYFGDLGRLPVDEEALAEATRTGSAVGGVGIILLFRAFSSGAVALTGTEAVADGVPAFRRPESKNAARTLVLMGTILGTYFLGISLLAHRLGPTVSDDETLLSILGRAVYGDGSALYYVLQLATFAILILAANTAYADFPRLSGFIARDGFLPRQLANRGDRLVFSNGIVILALAAGALIVLFNGDVSALIPLYATGVFTAFTLSQSGMVRYQLSHRTPGWKRRAVVNGLGATATAFVLAIVVISKFTIGAWIPAVLIPLIVLGFKGVKGHYDKVRRALVATPEEPRRAHSHTVVVLVGGVHKGVLRAMTYAESLRPDRLVALTVVTDEQQQESLLAQWDRFGLDVELRMVHSPYRDMTGPILRFLDELDEEWPDDIVTVIVPEFVLGHWWEGVFHNQSALALKTRLRQRPNTVIVSIPYHIGPEPALG
ncbi:MAG TPA: APC family permease, partial [Acidimicrobiia bacterium]|nr:APC family permease [Acidimicrobiia bacterium]